MAERGTSSPPAGGDHLAEYRRRKLELADLIRALMSAAAERHDDEKETAARELLARLAEDRFQLAVVGQFSRGKSTLMNAVLGRPYLPTGALPMTSVVTSVRYGSHPRAFVRRRDSSFPIETPLGDLVRFVAQSSEEREELRVVSAEVEVPAEILRLGFSFVDTPGIGSAIAANTATTESFLPDADAVIFVTSFDAPLSEAELDFLAKVRSHVEKLFLVVNKRDLVSEAEAESILRYVRERLGMDGAGAELRVFATSARRALESRLSGNRAALAASGLPDLEQPLLRFLTTEKARVFLLHVTGRAERLLARQKLDLEVGRLARSGDASERAARQARFDQSVEDLIAQLRGIAADLRDQTEARFSAALLERSRPWPEELKLLLRADLEQRWPRSGERPTRSVLEQTLAAVLESAQRSVEAWFRQRLPEVRPLLLQLAAGHIAKLEGFRQSVEGVGAEAFGLPGALKKQAGWSPPDLPQLAVQPLVFDVRLDRPRWSPLVPAARLDDARRRAVDALERGAVAYCDEARQALEEAAKVWVEAVGTGVEADTRKAVERLRERLQLPESGQQLALLEEIEQRLAGFRDELVVWDPTPAAEVATADLPARWEHRPTAMFSCAICDRIGGVPFDYLAHAQYDLSTRENSRAQHAESGGFCALHTWQYAETASDLGIALAYAELAGSAARLLAAAEESASTEQELREAVGHFAPDRSRCPVCLAVAKAELEAVADLVAHLPTDPRDTAAPPRLCMPHLAAVLAAEPGVERGQRLVRSLADVLERAAEDMRTYALKREALRRHLLNDEEKASYLQVISHVAGRRELVRPWRVDDRLPG